MDLDILPYLTGSGRFSIPGIIIEIKITTTVVIKIELKYFPVSEGNTCIADPNLLIF